MVPAQADEHFHQVGLTTEQGGIAEPHADLDGPGQLGNGLRQVTAQQGKMALAGGELGGERRVAFRARVSMGLDGVRQGTCGITHGVGAPHPEVVPHPAVVLDLRLGTLKFIDQRDRRAHVPGPDFVVHGHKGRCFAPVDVSGFRGTAEHGEGLLGAFIVLCVGQGPALHQEAGHPRGAGLFVLGGQVCGISADGFHQGCGPVRRWPGTGRRRSP